ncbi:hypothetical protein L596_028997 [Steinernema carpocapsae]|uniref:Uncharacterized protein n=1 Tax=Steinernema carpocapsae TaxID=34508 RepID=A0A4U5LTB8_STECR|nr:hypothetical protein L596_028997 [Steinernema carpocapsae]
MSSKHLRKLLQEKEENELPGAGESASESEEEDEKPVRSAPVNRFAALGLVHDDEDEEEDEPQEVVPKPSAPSNPSKTDKKKKKKANKKNRKKESDKKVEEDVEENAEEASAEVGRQQLYAKYLVVDAKDVNPENEMKRLLGKAFGAAPTANSKRRNATFVPGRIVKAKPTWPPVGSGLSSEIVKKEGDVTWFKFTHNAAYRNLQQLFWAGEKSYDHGLIQTIMEQNPYHLDSLLVMANMMRVQEDVQVARDLIAILGRRGARRVLLRRDEVGYSVAPSARSLPPAHGGRILPGSWCNRGRSSLRRPDEAPEAPCCWRVRAPART